MDNIWKQLQKSGNQKNKPSEVPQEPPTRPATQDIDKKVYIFDSDVKQNQFCKEWDENVERLKRSGRDLSKIRIVGKPKHEE